jgi:hypothetical protein
LGTASPVALAGCLDITCRMGDQLQIRLQQPPWHNPGFVRNFECALVIALDYIANTRLAFVVRLSGHLVERLAKR